MVFFYIVLFCFVILVIFLMLRGTSSFHLSFHTNKLIFISHSRFRFAHSFSFRTLVFISHTRFCFTHLFSFHVFPTTFFYLIIIKMNYIQVSICIIMFKITYYNQFNDIRLYLKLKTVRRLDNLTYLIDYVEDKVCII